MRALAVLAVVFYHADFSGWGGGFVGVDVFFVISGYLITSIILREIDRGSFSIVHFYERRFRRILPALMVVMVVTLVIGVVMLTPGDLEALGKSAVAASLFGSNILFYQEVGYFERPADTKPLLHTWSLAVEEQFYLFFPLLLLAVARFGKGRYAAWLAGLGAASTLLCAWMTFEDASFAFFLIPTRAWELFIGSILALHVLPAAESRRVRELLTVAGLGAIAYSVFAFDAETSFPGMGAAVPTLGTALVIHAGIGVRDTWAARILSLRPVVFVGLISYSLYLWHWPGLVYFRLYSIVEPELWATWAVLTAIFMLSVLSWRFVEEPIRKRQLFASRRSVFQGAVVSSLFVVAFGCVYVVWEGLPQRYREVLGRDFDEEDPGEALWKDVCEPVLDRMEEGKGLCTLGAQQGSPRFLLLGDSHARMLASGIDKLAEDLGVKGLIATKDKCSAMLSVSWKSPRTCRKIFRQAMDEIAAMPSLEVVVLASRWTLLAEGTRFKQERGKTIRLNEVSDPAPGWEDAPLWQRGLAMMVEELQALGKTVVVVGQVPEAGYDIPSAHYVAELTGRDLNQVIGNREEEFQHRTRNVQAGLKEIQDVFGIDVIDVAEPFCGDGTCLVVDDGLALYRDDDHLSIYGSILTGGAFEPLLRDLAEVTAPETSGK